MGDSDEQADRRAIYVPDDVAQAAAVPDDLDSGVDGRGYSVPDTNRRRRAGVVYLVGAGVVAVLAVAGLLPLAMWVTAVGLLVVGAYHVFAGWTLVIREQRALDNAGRSVSFAVGHASASLGFVGWRARPAWNVLVFSADDPPSQRGLVRVDGVDGSRIDFYIEDIPSP